MDHTPLQIDPPFGTFAPSPLQAAARKAAMATPRSWLGLRLSMGLRRLAGAKQPRAFDVEIFGAARARLHPYDNICEKRVYATPQHWDPGERARLRQAIGAHSGPGPFVFADIGANVGLYSLFAATAGRELGKDVRVIALEPQPDMRARLNVNFALSDIQNAFISDAAVTTRPQTLDLFIDRKNRGASSLTGAGDRICVNGLPLQTIFDQAGAPYIDAMKIDIEGAEYPALEAFFAAAPQTLWPRMIIMEVIHQTGEFSAHDLCLQNGYAVDQRTKMNAVLIHDK